MIESLSFRGKNIDRLIDFLKQELIQQKADKMYSLLAESQSDKFTAGNSALEKVHLICNNLFCSVLCSYNVT